MSERKRMSIFRATEATDLDHDTMPVRGVDDSMMEGFGRLAQLAIPREQIENIKLVFSLGGDSPMSLVHTWFKSGFVLPRHTHSADCLYYIVGGSLVLGTQTLGKGDGFFVPAGDTYTYTAGPEGLEILEFRTADKFDIVFKSNNAAHFDKIETSYKAGAEAWSKETPPFSGPGVFDKAD
jgi:quercetin dioxygenase-like cupin family protein